VTNTRCFHCAVRSSVSWSRASRDWVDGEGARPVALGVARVYPAELFPDGAGHEDGALGIEPDVRVDLVRRARLLVGLAPSCGVSLRLLRLVVEASWRGNVGTLSASRRIRAFGETRVIIGCIQASRSSPIMTASFVPVARSMSAGPGEYWCSFASMGSSMITSASGPAMRRVRSYTGKMLVVTLIFGPEAPWQPRGSEDGQDDDGGGSREAEEGTRTRRTRRR